jgi:hypothetical protein
MHAMPDLKNVPEARISSRPMSEMHPKADIDSNGLQRRDVPGADIAMRG